MSSNKTITTAFGQTFEITPEQYAILSWYATIKLIEKRRKTPENADKLYWQAWGLATACTAARIPWELTSDINAFGRIQGYQNMNRISEIQIFDYNL